MTKKNDNPSEGPQSGDASDAASAQSGRPSAAEYTTTGNTVVKTKVGHEVVPSDPSLPVVGPSGVKMSADNAKAVVAEFPDYASIQEGGE